MSFDVSVMLVFWCFRMLVSSICGHSILHIVMPCCYLSYLQKLLGGHPPSAPSTQNSNPTMSRRVVDTIAFAVAPLYFEKSTLEQGKTQVEVAEDYKQ